MYNEEDNYEGINMTVHEWDLRNNYHRKYIL